nr:hypothetical protein CFP56_44334 [Quercus suber]
MSDTLLEPLKLDEMNQDETTVKQQERLRYNNDQDSFEASPFPQGVATRVLVGRRRLRSAVCRPRLLTVEFASAIIILEAGGGHPKSERIGYREIYQIDDLTIGYDFGGAKNVFDGMSMRPSLLIMNAHGNSLMGSRVRSHTTGSEQLPMHTDCNCLKNHDNVRQLEFSCMERWRWHERYAAPLRFIKSAGSTFCPCKSAFPTGCADSTSVTGIAQCPVPADGLRKLQSSIILARIGWEPRQDLLAGVGLGRPPNRPRYIDLAYYSYRARAAERRALRMGGDSTVGVQRIAPYASKTSEVVVVCSHTVDDSSAPAGHTVLT